MTFTAAPRRQKAERNHAKRRLWERYGIRYSPAIRKRLLDDVKNGVALFVEKQSNRVSVFSGTVFDTPVRFVYDRFRKEIVTFLPFSSDEIEQ